MEFLLFNHDVIIPIEVKAGKNVRAKSLEKYINKYHPPKNIILSANPPRQNQQQTIYHLPLYLIEKITAILGFNEVSH